MRRQLQYLLTFDPPLSAGEQDQLRQLVQPGGEIAAFHHRGEWIVTKRMGSTVDIPELLRQVFGDERMHCEISLTLS